MDSKELQRAYGDSYTLERPGDGEAVHPYAAKTDESPAHPLDQPGTAEKAHSQAWGN